MNRRRRTKGQREQWFVIVRPFDVIYIVVLRRDTKSLFFLSRDRNYRRWNERIILWWSFTGHGKMKIPMNQLIVIQQWQPLESERRSLIHIPVSLRLLLNNRWEFPRARFLSVDNWCVKRWRTNDGSRREPPEDEFWFHRRTTVFSNDREQEDTLLWSVLGPKICRKWPAKQRSLLRRPSAESSRRRFSPKSNYASLNSTGSTRADRDREDSDRTCAVNRCLAKETRAILWSVVECRRCTASNGSVEDRDNSRHCRPDESGWIPNESSLETSRSFFRSRKDETLTRNAFRLLRQRRWFPEVREKLPNVFIGQSIAFLDGKQKVGVKKTLDRWPVCRRSSRSEKSVDRSWPRHERIHRTTTKDWRESMATSTTRMISLRFASNCFEWDSHHASVENFHKHSEGRSCRHSVVLNKHSPSFFHSRDSNFAPTETRRLVRWVNQLGIRRKSVGMCSEIRVLFDLFENLSQTDRRPRERHSESTESLTELNRLFVIPLLILGERNDWTSSRENARWNHFAVRFQIGFSTFRKIALL